MAAACGWCNALAQCSTRMCLPSRGWKRVGDVAGGVDVRVGGAQLRVDPDAVIDLEACCGGELAVGRDPDPGDDRVGRDVAAIGQAHPGGLAVVAGDLADLHAAAQVHLVVTVQVGEDLGDLAAEDPQQRQFRRLQHGDLDAGGAGRGRGLQADPAAADQRDP